MRLYLVQHGEAVPETIDPERPLSETGQLDIRRVAAFLAAGGRRVPHVLHSGKRRAEETAELLAARLAAGTTPRARQGLAPNDPTAPIAEEAAGWSEDTMLVGHMPFVAKLAARLLCGREDGVAVGFTPGSVLCLERDGEGGVVVAWFLRPDLVTVEVT